MAGDGMTEYSWGWNDGVWLGWNDGVAGDGMMV